LIPLAGIGGAAEQSLTATPNSPHNSRPSRNGHMAFVDQSNRNRSQRVYGKIASMATTIVRDPAILSGEPVFHGTRVPFKSLTDYLEHGRSLNEFLEDFPGVTREAAVAALEEARSSLAASLKN
jgi:uncharacterized protein (DUF433 family)